MGFQIWQNLRINWVCSMENSFAWFKRPGFLVLEIVKNDFSTEEPIKLLMLSVPIVKVVACDFWQDSAN